MKLWLLINLLPSVLSCPGKTSPTKPQTTPKPTIPKIAKTFPLLFTYSPLKYTACMDCRLININLTALVHNTHFKLDLARYAKNLKYMEKVSTMSIKGTYLSTFKFLYTKGKYEEITFLYSKTAVFGTIFYIKKRRKIHFTIRQLHPLITIIEERYYDFKPRKGIVAGRSFLPFTTLPG